MAGGSATPFVAQPSPTRSASRIPRGPFPATMRGGRGRCTGPGIVRASTAENQSPLQVVEGCRSSRSSSVTNSSNRSARSRPESDRPPSTAASNPGPPAPTPMTIRPPDITSSVISSLAKGTGCRKLGEATKVPRVSRDVDSAAAARVGTVACQSESTKARQARWSSDHACAKPYASTRDQRWSCAGFTSGSSATPTLITKPSISDSWGGSTDCRCRGLDPVLNSCDSGYTLS